MKCWTNKKEDEVLVKDVLKLELIDRETGKVVKYAEGSNSLGSTGSVLLLMFISGHEEDANKTKGWKYMYLFDGAKNYIKTLTGTFSTVTSNANYYYVVLTALDTSTDSYTTVYQGLYHEENVPILGMMNLWQNVTMTKPSDKILRAKWEVRIPYARL